jgi:hypothetical protein
VLGEDENVIEEEGYRVEFRYPALYAEYCIKTMPRYSAAVTSYCRAAVLSGQDVARFSIPGMVFAQCQTIEEVFTKMYGVSMKWAIRKGLDNIWWAHFEVDVTSLKPIVEEAWAQDHEDVEFPDFEEDEENG